MKNAINWFEIPVKNFEKAKAFYEIVLGCKMEVMEMEEMGVIMAIFPCETERGGIGGSIMCAPDYEPTRKGALVYLNAGVDLAVPLSRVENAGGEIIMPKTSLGPNGSMAVFIDVEGNRVAFHSVA
ncbi:MAG: VOC family protein [Cyclobacteriaceae bacterium]|nr:VOC family protein [Cyclobacteriaceae bacterium]